MHLLTSKRAIAPAVAMLGLAAFCIGCDQASKRVARVVLKGTETQSFLGDIFRLTYTENRGAFLGLGGGWPEPLRWLAVTAVALAGAVGSLVSVGAQLRRQREVSLSIWARVLIAAGGVGNLVACMRREGGAIAC